MKKNLVRKKNLSKQKTNQVVVQPPILHQELPMEEQNYEYNEELSVKVNVLQRQKDEFFNIFENNQLEKKEQLIQYETKIKNLNKQLSILNVYKVKHTDAIKKNIQLQNENTMYKKKLENIQSDFKNDDKLLEENKNLTALNENQKNIINNLSIEAYTSTKRKTDVNNSFLLLTKKHSELLSTHYKTTSDLEKITIENTENKKQLKSVRNVLQYKMNQYKDNKLNYETEKMKQLTVKNEELQKKIYENEEKNGKINSTITEITNKAMSYMKDVDLARREVNKVNNKNIMLSESKFKLMEANNDIIKELAKYKSMYNESTRQLKNSKESYLKLYQKTKILMALQVKAKEKVETNVTEQVETKVNEQVETKVNEQVETKVNEQVETKVNEQVETKVNEQVETNVTEQVETKVNEQVETKVTEQVETTIENDSSGYDTDTSTSSNHTESSKKKKRRKKRKKGKNL